MQQVNESIKNARLPLFSQTLKKPTVLAQNRPLPSAFPWESTPRKHQSSIKTPPFPPSPMAGRHRLPPNAAIYHHPPPPHAATIPRGAHPPPPASLIAALEDRIAAQHRDIRQLLADNQQLAASHVGLKKDLVASRQDLRLLADSAVRSKSEADTDVRDLYDRSLRAEEEVRRVEAMRAELAAVRSDVENLAKDRDELVEKAEKLRAEVAKAGGETGKIEEVIWEINYLRTEIERGRYDYCLLAVLDIDFNLFVQSACFCGILLKIL